LIVIDRLQYWTFTNRFTTFKVKKKPLAKKDSECDDPSNAEVLGAFYNEYNNVFCVFDNQDMRVFNANKG